MSPRLGYVVVLVVRGRKGKGDDACKHLQVRRPVSVCAFYCIGGQGRGEARPHPFSQ